MNLARRCSQDFDGRDWRRGKEYFETGAISIHHETGTGLTATVRGTAPAPYSVSLDWSHARERTLFVYCSCPRFDDVGLCKHVAATILSADEQGFGRVVPGTGVLFLEPLDVEPDDRSGGDRYGDDADDADADWDQDARRWQTSSAAVASGRSKKVDGEHLKVPRAKRRAIGQRPAKPKPPAVPAWKQSLLSLDSQQTILIRNQLENQQRRSSKPRQIWYLLDVERTTHRGLPCVTLRQRTIKKNGEPGKLKVARLYKDDVVALPSAEDRALLGLLSGNERDEGLGYSYGGYSAFNALSDFAVTPSMFEVVLPRLCASGRFGWLPANDAVGDAPVRPLAWDDGPAWRLRLDVTKTADRKHWKLDGVLERGANVADLSSALLLLAMGLVIFPDCVARFDAGTEFPWTALLRYSGPLLVPVKQEHELVEQLALLPCLPRADWPDELRWEEEKKAPRPQLTISTPKRSWPKDLECRLTFQYGDRSVPLGGGQQAWYDRSTRRVGRRDLEAELAAKDQLLAAAAQRPTHYDREDRDLFLLTPKKLHALVQQLTSAGWNVEAEGRLIRQAGELTISVTSGVDWFDLEGACDFGGVTASLPKLLAALRHGEQYVQLDDGTQGMLPAEWLARYAPLAELGHSHGDRLRFVPTQATLLDALLAAQETQKVTVDRAFAELRDRLRSFEGIQPRNEPKSFTGELRHYQREGLGWLHFLDEFNFGGCLADDMGLGKTVQILALLEERRAKIRRSRARSGDASCTASLVVVPRSLVFNWMEEARRFTPKLRVLNYTGLERGGALDRVREYDLVVTTYGTLRRDIARLRDVEFDYAVLDEAQAIKNASSQAAKACRLLRARRRLAMTGTPVENHLGELWSLFEFLNPGMLGRSQKLNQLLAASRENGRADDDDKKIGRAESLAPLAKALRPFLLRRTKQQVLPELPAKSEQTLYCELDSRERKLYEDLRAHYRRTLLERVGKLGVKKSKIHVLEALLRLRQAACHPGLLDKKMVDDGSSKLETLLEQLAEVGDEGHKALVFSQFTTLLAIVRRQLDRKNVVYEYLDGRTVDRQSKVERFQTDPDCRLFLISLKAGGQGLNLTAADYVFILDPWWNPAVEAQAVDRAHRIGQVRNVFAYRLIARNTVEEKILQLQDHKRGLAEAIVSADNSLLRNLTADDLKLLLS